jgi:type II secretory pathway pseudopilin PulG
MMGRCQNQSGAKQDGLTIIELLIAIPIASMIIIVIIGSLFTQYTAVLAESARSNLRSNGQTLLINLQDELLFTIAYGEELNTDLTDAHQPTDGWSYDSTPQTLIINEIALDSARRDESRNIVRQRTNNCETSPVTSNGAAINNVIYFIQQDPGNEFGSLVKRTITPVYDLCSIDRSTDTPCTPVTATCFGNAKETSCPAEYVGTGACSRSDSVLSENIKDISIEYFSENNILTTFPSAADKIEIVLTLGDTVYGREVEAIVKHTIRKIN